MATFYLPIIARHEYNAFWRILNPHLPSAYEKWLYLKARKGAEWQGAGHVVFEVDVNPDEFATFCDGKGPADTIDRLWQFALEKAAREASVRAQPGADK